MYFLKMKILKSPYLISKKLKIEGIFVVCSLRSINLLPMLLRNVGHFGLVCISNISVAKIIFQTPQDFFFQTEMI